MSEADGHASAIRAQGEAEAEIIFKKGEAEAKAMNVKAEAYQEYNQAAVIDKLFTGMPEIVRALASPLANVDKITIVSTGNDGAGATRCRHPPDGAGAAPSPGRSARAASIGAGAAEAGRGGLADSAGAAARPAYHPGARSARASAPGA